jgi:putative oxidoreductase
MAVLISSSPTLLVLGRFLLGGLFVYGGVHHFFIMSPLTSAISARGIPAPRLVLIAGSVFQIIFGALFILGIYVAASAFCLIAFTIVASIMLLNFWDMEGQMRQVAKTAWQTNLAIIGGLLIATAYPL